MKFIALLMGILMSCGCAVAAEPTQRHRVVFELNSGHAATWAVLLENVKNARAALGKTGSIEVEVVAHGNGIGFLLAAGNPNPQKIEDLAKSGVVFAACENTMKRKGITADQLLPIATPVDSGVAEVVRKQEAGWAYIRTSD